MKPNKPNKLKYIMPKCGICDKRFKVMLSKCMKFSIRSVDDGGKYHRTTWYTPEKTMCPTCREEFKKLGPKKFLDKCMETR